MNRTLLICLYIAIVAPVSYAGNFGPAPFRNGSPLVSGVDGTYQATARAENLTGIFRFAYSGGSQTQADNQNSWIFFVNGQVQRGQVVASINQSSLNGILDPNSIRTTNESGTISLPYVFISQNNLAAGEFEGKLQLKSPSGAFSGSGLMRGLNATTNTVIGINELVDPSPQAGEIAVTQTNYSTTASSTAVQSFKFRGVRTSTTSTSSTSTTSTTN